IIDDITLSYTDRRLALVAASGGVYLSYRAFLDASMISVDGLTGRNRITSWLPTDQSPCGFLMASLAFA
ncbi:MAG TPA: hypothetical protein VJ999_06620, partial [Candidatus Sulfotelmatobacter sp.]|nr:hypothetical protein [Candidatus Sulfotelmatobacter sp.]